MGARSRNRHPNIRRRANARRRNPRGTVSGTLPVAHPQLTTDYAKNAMKRPSGKTTKWRGAEATYSRTVSSSVWPVLGAFIILLASFLMELFGVSLRLCSCVRGLDSASGRVAAYVYGIGK